MKTAGYFPDAAQRKGRMHMIRLIDSGVTIQGGKPVIAGAYDSGAKEKTIAAKILASHNKRAADSQLHITFDGLISHDITYVGIIQTARASGLTRFPVPYVLTNCHNSLCAVGGTINEDDHVFGLSAAIKYGGDYVPANQAVIHQYAREMMTGCGKMILGSDSHTRYGAIGTMGVGEGGPELVKQLLQNTYDVAKPQVVLVWLTGEVPHGVGPHDVAIALCGATYKNGYVKNKVLEFAGPGVKHLPMDFRIGIDVMTTETACLSSIWETDEKVEEYLAIHGRPDAYRPLRVEEGAYYDSCIEMDLSKLEVHGGAPVPSVRGRHAARADCFPRRLSARGGTAGARAVWRQGRAPSDRQNRERKADGRSGRDCGLLGRHV